MGRLTEEEGDRGRGDTVARGRARLSTGRAATPPVTRRGRRRGRLLRRVLVGVAVLVVVVAGASARLFVWSPVDGPARVDAVVALGGDPGQYRAKKAVALAEAGYAPVAVVSLGGYPPAPCPRGDGRIRVLCFRADPLDTRGEAEYVARLAARRHWHRLIVVPERTQTTRARLLFERCTKARLRMVPVDDPPSHLLFDVVYEWGALVKALVFYRSC